MMKKLLLVAALKTALAASACGFASSLELARPESVGMSSQRLDYLKSQFQDLVDAEKTGGFQILIARRGKVVMYEHVGWADVEERQEVSEETLFRIYSMTKPVLAVAMMMLYEEGRYSLGDPLSKHIPEFAGLQVFAGKNGDGTLDLVDLEREPTVKDLMQHTAGFTYGWFGDTAIDALYKEKQILAYDDTLQELIDKLAGTPLLYQPGERWHYSVAVDVQGYLIEKWTGMPLATFLHERLFEPLGMDQTMAWVHPKHADLLADVYTHDEDGKRIEYTGDLATNHLRAPGGFGGGAQLISTSDDYWRFCQMLLNGGVFDGKRYLSPRTIELMTTNRLPDDVSFGSGGRGFGFNVGVVTDELQGEFPVSDGEYWWDGLATTLFWIDPEEELVAILLTQYLPWSAPFYRDLMHRLVRAAIID